jgi:alkylation response protein AidB-like acyl-CoA dehydrogenase
MAAIRPRDLLSDDLLERLGQAGALAGDITRLAEAGYLNVALPPEMGGLGCTLRQAACGQRRLARCAPQAALAVSAHLYWTGAAADACRAGDDSMRWILLEAARGALFAGGHGEAGGDLRFADPRSRCEPAADRGYRFHDPDVLSTATPAWDWIAVHAVHAVARPQSVIAFAGRGDRFAPAFRVARVSSAGTPDDAFTTSALTWGHSILASVQYSDARRALNDAITGCAEAVTPADFLAPGDSGPPAGAAPVAGSAFAGAAGSAFAAGRPGATGRPAGRWPVAEAGALLDAMKAKIAEITHPWRLVPEQAPDLGGQHLISLYAMRHEVAEGAARVHGLISQITGAKAPARPPARPLTADLSVYLVSGRRGILAAWKRSLSLSGWRPRTGAEPRRSGWGTGCCARRTGSPAALTPRCRWATPACRSMRPLPP